MYLHLKHSSVCKLPGLDVNIVVRTECIQGFIFQQKVDIVNMRVISRIDSGILIKLDSDINPEVTELEAGSVELLRFCCMSFIGTGSLRG
jgi:hypothetical protein